MFFTEISIPRCVSRVVFRDTSQVVSRVLNRLSLRGKVNILALTRPFQKILPNFKIDDPSFGIHLVHKLISVVDQIFLDITKPDIIIEYIIYTCS